MNSKYTTLKYACYTTNITMSVVTNLSPLLFLTFRSLYGISYSLLGLLVLVNFFTQLIIDLVFSFFSHKFNISQTVKITPVLAAIGMVIYAIWPYILPNHTYTGIMIGTIIFSVSCGLAEVLISPVIAAIPSDNTDGELSKLHSIYAWGVVGVVLVSTVFLFVFGSEKWQILALGFTLIPLLSSFLFSISKIPALGTPEKVSGALDMLKNKTVWLCVIAIFLGGASECTMSLWSSSYLEQAMSIPKIWGDLLGMAFFGIMLGLGRSLYAKFGENIERILLLGVIGATICYFVTAVTMNPVIGLITCGLTGLCASMLWPGSLIVASNRVTTGGVFIFAMMAAGGDLGASVGPQLVGSVTDIAMRLEPIIAFSKTMGLTSEQLGMKIGLLTGMFFPLFGIFVFVKILKTRSKD